MNRRQYATSEKETRKAEQWAETARHEREYADANKAKLGKRYGLRCRDAAATALKGNLEYHRGLGQGRLDAAVNLDYAEERLESAYNLGYYRGYTEYARDVRGGLQIDPTAYPLMEV